MRTISFWIKQKKSADVSVASADAPILQSETKPIAKGPNRKRSEKITLRMTPEERELLRSRAALVGMSQTDLVFAAIENRVFVVMDDVPELLMELRKQGVNLNQLTRRVNQHDHVQTFKIQQAIASCVDAQKEVIRFCRKWNVRIRKKVDNNRNHYHNGL